MQQFHHTTQKQHPNPYTNNPILLIQGSFRSVKTTRLSQKGSKVQTLIITVQALVFLQSLKVKPNPEQDTEGENLDEARVWTEEGGAFSHRDSFEMSEQSSPSAAERCGPAKRGSGSVCDTACAAQTSTFLMFLYAQDWSSAHTVKTTHRNKASRLSWILFTIWFIRATNKRWTIHLWCKMSKSQECKKISIIFRDPDIDSHKHCMRLIFKLQVYMQRFTVDPGSFQGYG